MLGNVKCVDQVVTDDYAIYQGVDEVVPVDVYVAGCPPRPEALIHGVLTLYEKVKGETFKGYAEKYTK